MSVLHAGMWDATTEASQPCSHSLHAFVCLAKLS
jgi:hypothetical protein